MKLEDTESSVVRYQGLRRILQEAQVAEYQLDKCRIVHKIYLKKKKKKKSSVTVRFGCTHFCPDTAFEVRKFLSVCYTMQVHVNVTVREHTSLPQTIASVFFY